MEDDDRMKHVMVRDIDDETIAWLEVREESAAAFERIIHHISNKGSANPAVLYIMNHLD
jgi:hypothetical protein